MESGCTFIVARQGDSVIGMLALRAERPFSLDGKLERLDQYLPAGRKPCEIRLLAVEANRRGGVVLRGLLRQLVDECDRRGFDVAVMSATTRQLQLYSHLGCVPFAHPVGTADALFQPMYITRERLIEHAGPSLGIVHGARHCFSTGPVAQAPAVARAMARPLVSHRSEAFLADLNRARAGLAAITGMPHAAILAGSGTLANDMVAAQLGATGAPGVVIADGEFGERLADHANRHRLPHRVLRAPWGQSPTPAELRDALKAASAKWVWGVHCETSTGVLHDLDALREAASATGAWIALDAMSSVGTIPLDLRGVQIAAMSSGKGLGAPPGLAIVAATDEAMALRPGGPRYLDLAAHVRTDAVPFTQPSPLIAALAEALSGTDWERRYDAVRGADALLRSALAEHGITPLVGGPAASPAVATWVVPASRRSSDVAESLEHDGFELGWRSQYLMDRNWIQTAFMGDFPRAQVAALAAALRRALARPAG
ncbi:MAG: alanine--glyoxylate aminotransferase family protein [Gemmatimonadetes bacterium]|nr:alanine--glyoxylate aminotransferase family protein [Gemmatimonadota bacterium]